MLKKNLDSVPSFEDGKSTGLSWTAPLRALLSSLAIIVLLPAALAAQGEGVSPTGAASPRATV
jgi:hypothetical protein